MNTNSASYTDGYNKGKKDGIAKQVTIESGSYNCNTTTDIDISAIIPNYEELNLTVNNFALSSGGSSGNCTSSSGGTVSIQSYANGIVTVKCGGWGQAKSTIYATVCCIYFE